LRSLFIGQTQFSEGRHIVRTPLNKLNLTAKNPEGKEETEETEETEVLEKLDPFIKTIGAKVDYSPISKETTLTTLYSYVQYFGCSSLFLHLHLMMYFNTFENKIMDKRLIQTYFCVLFTFTKINNEIKFKIEISFSIEVVSSLPKYFSEL